MTVQYADNNSLVFGNAIGWLGVQLIAAVALASPRRVERGRRLVPLWCLVGLSAAVSVFGLLLSTEKWRPSIIVSPALLSGVGLVAVAVGVAALFNRLGRALLPVAAAIAALILVVKYRAPQWGNNMPGESGPRSNLEIADVVAIVLAPIVVFLVVRAVTATVNRLLDGRTRRGSPIVS